MANLNLRNIPDELIRRMKVKAAENGVTLKEECLEIMRRHCGIKEADRRDSEEVRSLPEPSKPLAVQARFKTEQGRQTDSELFKPKPEVRETLRCQKCFGVLPYHQKGCKG